MVAFHPIAALLLRRQFAAAIGQNVIHHRAVAFVSERCRGNYREGEESDDGVKSLSSEARISRMAISCSTRCKRSKSSEHLNLSSFSF
jgi:hypothetical protein